MNVVCGRMPSLGRREKEGKGNEDLFGRTNAEKAILLRGKGNPEKRGEKRDVGG